MTISFRSRFDGMQHARDILIVYTDPSGQRGAAAPLAFSAMAVGKLTEPTIVAGGVIDGDQFLQAALDHAWEIGLRPKGFNDTTQQVAALKDHLSDMRALVFERPPTVTVEERR